MIRIATVDDIDLIEDTYNEHFEHEIARGAFTVFKKGVYPTRKDAEKALETGTLYVYEENRGIAERHHHKSGAAGGICRKHVEPPPTG